MNPIFTAVISVSVIGLLSALMLSVAAKIMAVKVDERFLEIRAQLPGANCGACGYAGCDAYAQALVDDSGIKSNLCTPGGEAVAKNLSAVLGVESESVKAIVAAVRCNGDCEKSADRADYSGPKTCKAATLFYGGMRNCTYGCLGYGDCAVVCPHNAIDIKNGIAVVDSELCVGCKLCISVCPKSIIEMVPKYAAVYVACSSKDKGAVTRKNCSVGCIACKKCEKACQFDAILVTDNLASIDYEKCTDCKACVSGCLPKCILER